MKAHESDPPVRALKVELEADTYEDHAIEDTSDHEDDTDIEDGAGGRAEICQAQETRTKQEVRRADQTEAGKQIEEANKDLDELRKLLTSDTAAGGDVMATIMEQLGTTSVDCGILPKEGSTR